MIKKFLQKLFKLISYGIYFKIYGRIKNHIGCEGNSNIDVKNLDLGDNLKYKVYKVNNGRLYTDRIHDTAAILDDKIIEGPSFQIRYETDFTQRYSKINDNIVFSKGTPRIARNLNGKVLSLLTGGGGNNNYWHWLYDVLPRIDLCSKFVNLDEIDFFLLPSLKRKFQKETLDCLNIPEHKRISSEKYRHIRTKELIVTDHPVVITGNATNDILNIPYWISLWLKKKFLISNSNNNKNKIFIDRNDKTTNGQQYRSISNDDEIKKYLLKNNFNIVKLQNIHFTEQVNLFQNAECVVGLHGGGFGNISFCKPNTKIIELRSKGAGNAIKNLATKNKLNYNSIVVESIKEEIPSYSMHAHQDGRIHVPLDKLIKIMEG